MVQIVEAVINERSWKEGSVPSAVDTVQLLQVLSAERTESLAKLEDTVAHLKNVNKSLTCHVAELQKQLETERSLRAEVQLSHFCSLSYCHIHDCLGISVIVVYPAGHNTTTKPACWQLHSISHA